MAYEDDTIIIWPNKHIRKSKVSHNDLVELAFLYEASRIINKGLAIPDHLIGYNVSLRRMQEGSTLH